MSGCGVYLIASDATAPNGPWLRGADKNDRLLKIGISADPIGRLATLQTANPSRLTMEKIWSFASRQEAHDVEWHAHDLLRHYRLCGEWFFSDPWYCGVKITEIIATMASQVWDWHPEYLQRFLVTNGYALEDACVWTEVAFGDVEVAQ